MCWHFRKARGKNIRVRRKTALANFTIFARKLLLYNGMWRNGSTNIKLSSSLNAFIVLLSLLVQYTSSSPMSGAFVTIFYEDGPTSGERFLAIRVLMRSIERTNSKFDRYVLVPSSVGISDQRKMILEREGIYVHAVDTLVTTNVPGGWSNPLAHLIHWRNWLALWDDPVLRKKDRWVAIEPECMLVQ